MGVVNRKTYIAVLFGAGVLGARMAGAIATADDTVSAENPADYGYSLNWDYVYKFRNSSSVAVDHYWILTAAHVADDGASGNLTIDGETYTPQETIYHSIADLALVRFDKPFPGYYPLHDDEIYSVTRQGRNEITVFDELLLSGFGRTGTVTAISFENGPGGNGTRRWGTNRGTGETTVDTDVGGTAGSRSTLCFTTSFTQLDTSYEAGAAQYDSGGPVFIDDGGEWNVAGISLYLMGSSPNYTGNAIGKVSYYRDWIANSIPNYDSDMDGLPDHWESSTGETDATADPDLDGFTNYEEWIADTDPTAYSSHLKIETYTDATNMAFSSSSDREYLIEYCTDLTNMNWQTEQDWFSAGGTQTVQAVSRADTNRFYRVRVKLP